MLPRAVHAQRVSTPKRDGKKINELQGAARLVLEATEGVTGIVESMQRSIGSGPDVLGRPLQVPVDLFAKLVYGGIRGVTQLVAAGLDAVLARFTPLLGAITAGREYDTAVAVLNGVLGDYLSETHNPLAIQMRFRREGRPLELEPVALRAAMPRLTGKLLVLVHGSCLSDWQWTRLGQDYGAALERDLGYTAVYLHYNTGLHVSTNGRAFAELLEQLVAAWPEPIEELAILAHSLGGLTARSACLCAEQQGYRWRRKLRKLVCLGTPHHGASLERGGNWVDYLLAISRYSAPLARLGKIRSAGVTDMRFGYVLDEQWQGRDRFDRGGSLLSQPRLPANVDCYAAAATRAVAATDSPPSDGLVSVDSALGRHAKRELALEFPEAHQWIGFGITHLDLLGSPAMYAVIRSWLSNGEHEVDGFYPPPAAASVVGVAPQESPELDRPPRRGGL